MLRTGSYGDGFGRRADGLTLDKLRANPHGIDLGALKPQLPGILETPSRKIDLAPTLILDDLPAMDDAELRRGEPTLHRAHGEDLAILSAVALLNRAYGLVASTHALTAPRRWPLQVVIDRVLSAVGWDGTIGGEAVDLHSEGGSLEYQTLEYIHSRKTGALFVAAAAVGAMLANATDGMLASGHWCANGQSVWSDVSDGGRLI